MSSLTDARTEPTTTPRVRNASTAYSLHVGVNRQVGIAVTGPNTAMIAYSDFTKTAPDGKRAKSIMVRKITVEGE